MFVLDALVILRAYTNKVKEIDESSVEDILVGWLRVVIDQVFRYVDDEDW